MSAARQRGSVKVDGPETLAQAVEFERRRLNYKRAGLCHRCASQAAYGHQIGFTRVHPPCVRCVVVVAAFPESASNAWRKYPRGRFSAPSTRSERSAPPSVPERHEDHARGAVRGVTA